MTSASVLRVSLITLEAIELLCERVLQVGSLILVDVTLAGHTIDQRGNLRESLLSLGCIIEGAEVADRITHRLTVVTIVRAACAGLSYSLKC